MLGRLIVFLVILSAITGLIANNWLHNAENRVVTFQARNIIVANGATMRGFADQLVADGLLNEPWSFRFWARYRGLSSSLKTGEYQIPADATMNELLLLVTSGQVIDYPVTFIEGWSFKQLRAVLAKQNQLKHVIDKLDNQSLMKAIGAEGIHPEGRFYPDTYHYTASMTDLDILRQAYNKMDKFIEAEWQKRDENLPLKNRDQALTLASIIEKETGAEIERPLIAGVFINRLRKGMLLQTDPTVIYGMGDSYNGNIRRKDLHRDTPYNTYTRAGLPPTPIAMPGGEAIKATLHPAQTNALYFVAKGDGTHYFSATLREHNNAVNKYQIKRRKNYTSSKTRAE
jgi:UPF0755 protein